MHHPYNDHNTSITGTIEQKVVHDLHGTPHVGAVHAPPLHQPHYFSNSNFLPAVKEPASSR